MKGARSMPQVNIRMPEEMKGVLEAAAQRNFRSLSAEINARLILSLQTENARPAATGRALVTQ